MAKSKKKKDKGGDKDPNRLAEEMAKVLDASIKRDAKEDNPSITHYNPTSKVEEIRGTLEHPIIYDEVAYDLEDEVAYDLEDEVVEGVASQTSTKFRSMLEEKPNSSRKYLDQVPKYG